MQIQTNPTPDQLAGMIEVADKFIATYLVDYQAELAQDENLANKINVAEKFIAEALSR